LLAWMRCREFLSHKLSLRVQLVRAMIRCISRQMNGPFHPIANCVCGSFYPIANCVFVFIFLEIILGRHVAGACVCDIVQRPMEAVHGRQSLLLDAMAAGMLGCVRVSRGVLGVPFIDPSFACRCPQALPPMLAFVVHGGIAGASSAFGGKSL
jgi:hypothetical protein